MTVGFTGDTGHPPVMERERQKCGETEVETSSVKATGTGGDMKGHSRRERDRKGPWVCTGLGSHWLPPLISKMPDVCE